MLNYVITFFILAIVAAFLGFGGLAASFAEIDKFMAFIFLILFTISMFRTLVTKHKDNMRL